MEQIQALKELGLTKEIYELIQQWGRTNGLVFNDINFEQTSDSGESGDSGGKDKIAPGSVRTGDTTAPRLTGAAASAARSAFPSSSPGKSSVAAKLDEPKAAAAFRPVVEPAKQSTKGATPSTARPTAANSDISTWLQDEYNKTFYIKFLNNLNNLLKDRVEKGEQPYKGKTVEQIRPGIVQHFHDLVQKYMKGEDIEDREYLLFPDKNFRNKIRTYLLTGNDLLEEPQEEQTSEEAKNSQPTQESKYINPRQPKSFIRHPSLVGFMR